MAAYKVGVHIRPQHTSVQRDARGLAGRRRHGRRQHHNAFHL